MSQHQGLMAGEQILCRKARKRWKTKQHHKSAVDYLWTMYRPVGDRNKEYRENDRQESLYYPLASTPKFLHMLYEGSTIDHWRGHTELLFLPDGLHWIPIWLCNNGINLLWFGFMEQQKLKKIRAMNLVLTLPYLKYWGLTSCDVFGELSNPVLSWGKLSHQGNRDVIASEIK